MLHSVGCIGIATLGTPLRGVAWGGGKHRYRPLGPYQDNEFQLQLLRAKFEGVEIDVNQAEDAYGRSSGR